MRFSWLLAAAVFLGVSLLKTSDLAHAAEGQVEELTLEDIFPDSIEGIQGHFKFLETDQGAAECKNLLKKTAEIVTREQIRVYMGKARSCDLTQEEIHFGYSPVLPLEKNRTAIVWAFNVVPNSTSSSLKFKPFWNILYQFIDYIEFTDGRKACVPIRSTSSPKALPKDIASAEYLNLDLAGRIDEVERTLASFIKRRYPQQSKVLMTNTFSSITMDNVSGKFTIDQSVISATTTDMTKGFLTIVDFLKSENSFNLEVNLNGKSIIETKAEPINACQLD